jgi:hypothetical protein
VSAQRDEPLLGAVGRSRSSRRLAARADETDDGDGYEHPLAQVPEDGPRGDRGPARAEIVRLRNAGLISNEIMHRVERELDLEDGRLEI